MKSPVRQFHKAHLVGVAFLLFFIFPNALANSIAINPVDDGWIYTNGVVVDYMYLTPGWESRGVVEFPTSDIPNPLAQALLSVNPYALPLWCPTIEVYGYDSYDGQLTSSDYDAGEFLGTWMLPFNLGYGQDAFFDVTQFLQGVDSPYVGFNLRTTSTSYHGSDQFSSLERNYGHPSQLMVSPIPEPASITMLLLGIPALALIGFQQRRKRCKN